MNYNGPRPHCTILTITAAALVLTACGDDTQLGTEPLSAASPTEVAAPHRSSEATRAAPTVGATATTEPADEEAAEQEIDAAFEDLITKMDQYYANAIDLSDAEHELWGHDVMDDWPLTQLGVGELELDVYGWALHEADQVGETIILSHEVVAFETIGSLDTARSTGCVDLGELEYVNSDGDPVEIPQFAISTNRWWMIWHYIEDDSNGPWLLEAVRAAPDESC
ncbi:hypothetical protein G1H11_04845 [Phytoactinopolyspora alkaliphila]|uniref:Uncharacterized protein n=1 Tax=Phytoactinopolyspora alkaliphila TaxID=1783498 RepID=A0A6N9YI45_9ACTN|nr:hypothetical protein [Phytoactinopolyspora alkaliphila]NED94634.1 hypothetical protein [Phytoactinopolyspora alkaliphila]